MAETLTYQSLKNTRLAKETEDQRKTTRKRNIFVLIRDYLYQMGYVDTSTTLETEINIDLNQFGVCDNVDLETILQDYESYYYIRFQKYPQIVKKFPEGGGGQNIRDKQWKALRSAKGAAGPVIPKEKQAPRRRAASCFPAPVSSPTKGETKVESNESQSSPSLSLNGQQISSARKSPQQQFSQNNGVEGFRSDFLPNIIDQESRLLKPLGLYSGYNEEWKELASVIGKDIYQHKPNVRWDNIIGLDEAKRLIKESVVYPIKYPQLFTGILSPWKGLLLYGPPGTGKTLLAKAVATECQTTFFNISASSIVSKWRGDSEKLVRVLFELARFHAPSTIFVDELDSLMSQRDSSGLGSEHEGSRRMKTELLIQMDGLSKTDDLVFLLAASNLPWELDHAMLRRLEKRILVGLPNSSARQAMYEYFLPSVIYSHGGLRLTSQLDYRKLAELSDGYSGSDILLVSKEAAMQRVRKVLELLEQPKKEGNEPPKLTLDTITTKDVEIALQKTKPSARRFADKYDAWQKEFGST